MPYEYANAEACRSVGIDPVPADRDWVAWSENGVEWTVCTEDDLEGPSALHHWPDGGWCNVRLVRRGSTTIPIQPEQGGQ